MLESSSPSPTTGREISFGRFKIAVVAIDRLDLLDKNARFFRAEVFRKLVENIKQDGQLSQIPFCVRRGDRFLVLSGNHRVKAAKAAGLDEIPIIYTDDQLTADKELAIQLSHNAIVGQDDPIVLAALWADLKDVSAKLYSGLDDQIMATLPKPDLRSLCEVRMDFRTLSFMFLPEEVEQVKDAFKAARELVKGNATYLARFGDFDRVLDALAVAGGANHVTNGATGLLLMLGVFLRHMDDLKDGFCDPETYEAKHKGWVPLAAVFGNDKVPADAAAIIRNAVDAMVKADDLDEKSKVLAIERWAADYLAGVPA